MSIKSTPAASLPNAGVTRAALDLAQKVRGNEAEKAPAKATSVDATPKTALEDHISFFENLAKGGTVNAKSTRGGLDALGLGMGSVAVGGHALTVAFAIPQAEGALSKIKAGLTGELAINRIDEGVRGVDENGKPADSGVYDKEGNINSEAFMSMWKEFAGDKGYLNNADIVALVEAKPINALEFGLLMELAGKVTTEGERVLTPETMLSFYDGSLFQELAKARADGVLFKPTGALKHDGTQQIAKNLASLALQSGGVAAGEGGKALYGAQLTIDVDASLAYQQETKSLGDTVKLAAGTALKDTDSDLAQSIGTSLAGAFKAMCHAGKG